MIDEDVAQTVTMSYFWLLSARDASRGYTDLRNHAPIIWGKRGILTVIPRDTSGHQTPEFPGNSSVAHRLFLN